MSLSERVAVITGATGVLGSVVARRLVQIGARLALFSSNQAKLDQLVADLALAEPDYLTAALDFRQPGAAKAAAAATLVKFGRIDLLLHFVGGWTGGTPLIEVEAEQIQGMLDQHVWTTFHLVQGFVPYLVENGWGRVVIISSPQAGLPSAKSAPYAAAKAAQEAMILSLAQELKSSGVTANVLRVQTIDIKHQRLEQPNPANATWTTPEEIATAIEYLCSDEAGMVNGARLPLYGSP